ncbi:2597_t:CDS:2, partial [Gigaspora rosea]
NVNDLNRLFDNINSNQVMTLIQISMLLQIIKSKILKIQQDIEFNEIKTEIEKETNTAKLEVDWSDKINSAIYLFNKQKNTLHHLRNDRYWNLRGNEAFNKFKKDIENETFINNLLDGNLYDTLITTNILLNEEQKKQLHELQKQQINNIKNEQIVSRLEDKGYYDSRIDEIRESFLSNRKLEHLHKLRRFQLDKLQALTEDALFDTLSELLDYIEDLEELADESQITSDIKKLNQTLLTNERYVDQLNKKRKTRYHNNLYNNIEAAINIETEIKKLQDNWKIKIDAEIDQTFLLLPKSIKKIYQIREVRIATLHKPPKRPAEDPNKEFFPTRMPDNAKPIRNTSGNINVQISFIVDEYK